MQVGHGLPCPFCFRIRQIMFEEATMDLFSKTNLPMTLVIVLIVWAWISFLSVVLGSLF